MQENHIPSSWTVGITATCWLSLIALVALMSSSPTASNWVSDAAQAEFVSSIVTPDTVPVQIAAGKAH